MSDTGDTRTPHTAVDLPLVARLHVDFGRCATALCSGVGVR
ncbi:MAG TPA: hypothetical protein VLH10_00120 [Yinghuangia sp.]|nr:hypothetical protein [Yinghuangia sp.]